MRWQRNRIMLALSEYINHFSSFCFPFLSLHLFWIKIAEQNVLPEKFMEIVEALFSKIELLCCG